MIFVASNSRLNNCPRPMQVKVLIALPPVSMEVRSVLGSRNSASFLGCHP